MTLELEKLLPAPVHHSGLTTWCKTCSAGNGDHGNQNSEHVFESVNDSFVMNAWFENQGIKNVKALPDGNFEFTSRVGALVEKGNLGFGKRSWRYAMVINDNVVEHVFAEDDMRDLADTDPYEASAPENVLEALTSE